MTAFWITVKLATWLGFIVAWAFYNGILIHAGKRPIYIQHFIAKGAAAFMILLWLGVEPRTFTAPFIFLITSFWVVFNPLLNYLRGLPYFYTGENSGWIDSWLHDQPQWVTVVLYFLTLIVCVLATIVTYQTL